MHKIIRLFTILVCFIKPIYGFTQNQDTTQHKIIVKGTISVTNNGFSFIPAFTLDKPAGLAYLTIEKGRFTFNTDIRYALEGRPWALSFISRYKLVNTAKTQVSIGVYYPGISFVKIPVLMNGQQKEIIEAQQSIAPELNIGFPLSNRFVVGGSYLYNRGIGNAFVRNGHYTALWSGLSDIKLSKKLRLAINAQVFYLTADNSGGSYISGQFILSKNDFPLTLSSMMFKTISSNLGGKDANWNLSLNYIFKSK